MVSGESGRNEDHATRALVREVGRRSVERLGDGLTRIVGEGAAIYRWLLSMLVLLNGAGLYLCLGQRAAIGPALFDQVVTFFFLGALAAIIAALVGMAFTLPVAGAMRKALTHWTDVAVSGELSDEALASAKWVRRASTIWLVTTSLIVLISLILFLFGTALIAQRFGIVKEEATPAPVAQAAAPAAPVNAAPAVPDNAAQPTPVPTPAPSQPVAAARPVETSRPAPVRQAAPAPRATSAPRPAATQAPRPAQTSAPSPAPSAPAPQPAAPPAPAATP